MSAGLGALVERALRIPASPEPPPGPASELRVFRAGRGHLGYRTVLWALAQLGVLAFALAVGGLGLASVLTRAAELTRVPWVAFAVGAPFGLLFATQLVFSYVALRLDHDMRWYMLGEDALRIREGVFTVGERTMGYENIQQVSVRRGPLQAMLGIGDIEVRSAGGGGPGSTTRDTHRGFFRGVEDPERVVELIRSRVEQHRSTGLGQGEDPDGADDAHRLRAAHMIQAEIRRLRSDLASAGRSG